MASRVMMNGRRQKRRCRMSVEAIRMAKELGQSPRSLLRNIPGKQQQWKAPVEDWVRNLCHFGQCPKGKPEC